MAEKKQATSGRRKRFQEPPVSATPGARRKMVVIGVCAGVLLLLLWVATLPLNFHKEDKEAAGPRTFFSVIAESLSQTTKAVDMVKTTTDAMQ